MLLQLLQTFTDEIFMKSDINTSRYILYTLKVFFFKVRERMQTSERTLWNYWEIIVINLCNQLILDLCRDAFKDMLIEDTEDFKSFLRYINRESFLDSLSNGDYSSLIANYKDFVLYEKNCYVCAYIGLGMSFFSYIETVLFMVNSEMSFLDKLTTNVGVLICFVNIFNCLEKYDNSKVNIQLIEMQISRNLMEFTSNIFLINETVQEENEFENITKIYKHFMVEAVNKNYLLPFQLDTNLMEIENFQSYLMSFVFSITTYNFSVRNELMGDFFGGMQSFEYFLSKLALVIQKRQIFKNRLLEYIETPIFDIISHRVFSGRNVTVKFENTSVISNFNYDFSFGEWISIYGESGCGKTTLCNLILGRISNYEGEVTFCSKKYNYFNVYEHISFVSPNGGIFKKTIRENCLYGLKEEVSDKRLNYYLQLFELKGVDLESQSENLSTGQKQRIKIIRMILHDRPILFLDEITANLDYNTSLKILNEIRKISTNKLVISVTHNKKLISDGDRIFTFDGNNIIQGYQ